MNNLSPTNSNFVNPPRSGPEISFDPWLLWVAFRRNWYWATPLGAILAGIGAFIVHRSFVPEYMAAHILQANREYVVFQGILQAPTEMARNERPLIYNQLVLGPVLADSKICEAPSLLDPAKREMNLRRNMSVSDPSGTSQMLQIAYKDTDPVAAAMVCNAIVRTYLEQRRRFDDRRIQELDGWLKPALNSWEKEVEGHRSNIKRLSEQNKGFNPFKDSSHINADTTYLNRLRDDLSELRSEEAVLEAEFKMMLKAEEGDKPIEVLEPDIDEIDEVISQMGEIVSIQREIESKKGQMQGMDRNGLVAMRQGHFDKLANDIEDKEREMKKVWESLRQPVRDKLKTKAEKKLVAQRSANVVAKHNQLLGYRTRRSVFEANYDAEEERLSKFAGETAELYFAQQRYDQATSILVKLNERLASIKTERQKSSSMQTLAEAVPPSYPIEVVPWKKVILVASIAFVIPFCFGLLWEIKSKRVTDAASLETSKSVPVLGEVVRVPSGIKLGRKQRVYEESIETLRANMMFSTGVKSMRSIVVASSMSGEGKSSLASHLALSLTRATDQPVLLIDADLRSPDQHHLFGIEMGAGLAGVLAGKCALKDAIDRSLGSHLHVLPAGVLESNPHRLVSAEAVRDLIEKATELYEYVIIDTAPVLAAGETLCLAAAVDATLVCVMRDVSRHDHIRRCMYRLEAAGANVIGTIFSGVSTLQYSYRYGDYRYAAPTLKS